MSESYNRKAIRGCGLVKGSKEAKAYMAYLRSLRGKNKKKRGGKIFFPNKLREPIRPGVGQPGTYPAPSPWALDLHIPGYFRERTLRGSGVDADEMAEFAENSAILDKVIAEKIGVAESDAIEKEDKESEEPNVEEEQVDGSGLLGTASGMYLKLLGRLGKDWWNESHSQQDELKRLEQLKKNRMRGGKFGFDKSNALAIREAIQNMRRGDARNAGKILRDEMNRNLLRMKKGGKFELGDVRDFLAGPLGWVRMGMRKSRQNKIDALKNELGLK